jgi:hypothetical protein
MAAGFYGENAERWGYTVPNAFKNQLVRKGSVLINDPLKTTLILQRPTTKL